MDNLWKRHFLRNTKGQSTVEYVLLLGVIVLLVLSVIRSKAFKDFLGDEGKIFVAYKDYMECSYHLPMPCDRLGKSGSTESEVKSLINGYKGTHPGYTPGAGTETRFFGPIVEYKD